MTHTPSDEAIKRALVVLNSGWSINDYRSMKTNSFGQNVTLVAKHLTEVDALVRAALDYLETDTHPGIEIHPILHPLLLPDPVDPDILEARRIVETTIHWSPQTDRELQSGKNDNTAEMKIAVAALKRGKELAKS